MTCPTPDYCSLNGCSGNACSPAPALGSRFVIVPCEDTPHADLAVIWDRREEQVVDVISKADADRWSAADL